VTLSRQALLTRRAGTITDRAAKAKLAAAAPDLLAALQFALRALEIDGPKSACSVLLLEGRAAVAKAVTP
jgi:hypothetical protein